MRGVDRRGGVGRTDPTPGIGLDPCGRRHRYRGTGGGENGCAAEARILTAVRWGVSRGYIHVICLVRAWREEKGRELSACSTTREQDLVIKRTMLHQHPLCTVSVTSK